MATRTRVPALGAEGWFTPDSDEPTLIGQRCLECGTYVFPRANLGCPNPACSGVDLEEAPLASASVVKAIPLLGTLVGGVSWLALAGASTYAVGKVFIQHFESGGTLLTLDPEKVMDYYREQLHGYQRAQARDGDSEDYEGVEP